MIELVRSLLNIIIILSLVSSSYAYHAIPIQAHFLLPGRSQSSQQVCSYKNQYIVAGVLRACLYVWMTQSIISSQSSQRFCGELLTPPV